MSSNIKLGKDGNERQVWSWMVGAPLHALSKPAGAAVEQRFGFHSRLSVHCEKQSIRWVWEGRGCPTRDAFQWWDCLWFSQADMMNGGYCQDVLEHMDELVGRNLDLPWTLRWCINVTYCSCKHESAACAWNPYSSHVFPSNEMVRVPRISTFLWEMYEKRTCVFGSVNVPCLRIRFVPLQYVIHIQNNQWLSVTIYFFLTPISVFRLVENVFESKQGFELWKIDLKHGFSGYGLAGEKSIIKGSLLSSSSQWSVTSLCSFMPCFSLRML